MRERYIATLGEVREVPGLERYLVAPGFNEIKQAAADFPVLYLWSSRFDISAVLVLGDGTIVGRYLDGLDNEWLSKPFGDWIKALERTGPDAGEQLQRTLALIGEVLRRVGLPGLVQQVLTERYSDDPKGPGWRWGPVTLVVSGLLSYFPVHAWTPCIIDNATGRPRYHMPLMCAPSARQALGARRSPRPTGAARRLLSIADPQPESAGLPLSRVESTLIARTAQDPLLLHGEEASLEAFLAHAGKYEVLHLACHGSGGTGDPDQACLHLATGQLSLNTIINNRLLDNTALVVLSACRTGQADRVLPDESLDVGSVFLAAGARAVVSTMWPVDDLAATLFTWQLFSLWDWGAGLALPAAVHASRLWMRDLTVGDLNEIGYGEPALQPGLNRYTLGFDPSVKRFDEPYYWAAFTYTGG